MGFPPIFTLAYWLWHQHLPVILRRGRGRVLTWLVLLNVCFMLSGSGRFLHVILSFARFFRNSSLSAIPLVKENIIPCMFKSKGADIQNLYSKLRKNSIYFLSKLLWQWKCPNILKWFGKIPYFNMKECKHWNPLENSGKCLCCVKLKTIMQNIYA